MIALEWTGLDGFEKEIRGGSEFAQEVNPANAVPALRLHNDYVLTQNTAILSYIAKLAKKDSLLGGDDLLKQSEVLKWSAYLAGDLHPAFRVAFFTQRFSGSEEESKITSTRKAGFELVKKKLAILESHMEGRDYMVGDEVTIADAHMFPILGWVRTAVENKKYAALAPAPGWHTLAGPAGLRLEDYPNLERLFNRLAKDKGIQAAIEKHTK